MSTPQRELRLFRQLLTLGASVYLCWWFVVQASLPGSFNPLPSRLAVVGVFVLLLVLSFVWRGILPWLRILTYFAFWILTGHFFYLFAHNAADVNWVLGAYVTVVAVSACFFSATALFSYSIFVVFTALLVSRLFVETVHPIFIPGLITQVFLVNFGMRSRLNRISTLRQLNQRFQTLFDSTFEGIAVHANGRIVEVNESFGKIFHYRPAELVGKELNLLFEEYGLPDSASAPAAREVRGILKDGGTVALEIRERKLQLDKQDLRLSAIRDLSDRKKVEGERLKLEAAEAVIQARDELISIASHELKTPVTSIKIQTEMVLRLIRSNDPSIFTPERVTRFTLQMDKQANRLAKLIEDMLDVARISRGQVLLEKETFDLALVAQEAVTVLTDRIEVRAQGPVMIHADRYRMEQVITNLATNALKYGKDAPISLSVRKTGKNATVEVEDHGIGISPESLGRIFKRFERAVSAKNISGLGVGLYIAQQIVEAHGGQIAVESKPGLGSKFTVIIPRGEDKFGI